ncbi:superoxide dismutase [Pochonia chlamydosporia 170]|uniref:Superoxide dismutase n=1 Tax=Pochonia chlamydosporia 170 TaxID=1380566 RepID=A0A179G2V7_METCM|nr:superoxide dismutase [Pochonia chlamydosporia 170]OAQ72184.1 superoxide dismutase [Pochonia chlamydosporia 170]
MFRSRLLPRAAKSIGLGPRINPNATRSLHQVPTLPHDYSQGVPNLMSPGGFAIAWSDYMSLTVEKLNALTAGTELEDKDTKTISLLTAREPSQAPIFNYASMAHNNHFFFQGISPAGTPMPETLRAELEACFSSIETLRREFIITASAMFGPGFVWLVKAGPSDFRVLPTYLAGSPYPGAHWRAQPTDMNTVGNDGSAKSYFKNQVYGNRKRSGDLPPGGIELEPLLCLNTWEHAWLLDWGVGAGGNGGKIAYAEAWWNLIDWERVAHRAGSIRPEFKTAAQ